MRATLQRLLAFGGLPIVFTALAAAALGQKGKPPPPPPPPVVPTADRVLYDLSVTVKKVAETDIYWMYTSGTGKTQITSRNGYHEGLPTWSPDGSRIAYIRHEVGKSTYYRTLWTMAPDGSAAICVIPTLANWGVPAWSPDGSRIALWDSGSGPTVVECRFAC